eukprot:TRINITY_DN19037_c0_g1_i2.p1 TRINITY_DN19037_c0_g1~~TRINITY_DN19037_c0_g1_i2.p1  ORF type:complete len:462 (+),score=73.20 TRINITY_DN19037_c0_g1_i2:146-1387(+)
MALLTGTFFCVELVAGIVTDSLALISDAFHMFSDVLALGVGFAAIQFSKRGRSAGMSYGWGRAEVVGGLINGTFLLSVCIFVTMEAIPRFFSAPDVKPDGVIIVAALGLLVNLLGVVLFAGAHHHHGHSHHDSATPSSSTMRMRDDTSGGATPTEEETTIDEEAAVYAMSGGGCISQLKVSEVRARGASSASERPRRSLNMRAVLLHVVGDALASVGVLISGLVIKYGTFEDRFLVDPGVSLLIALIILRSAVPLWRRCAMILLQSVPEGVSMARIYEEIMDVEGVLDVHELHLWQLSDSKIIASVHITCQDSEDFMQIAASIKMVLHEKGIHSSTIQPEFYKNGTLPDDTVKECLLACPDKACQKDWCCEDLFVPELDGDTHTPVPKPIISYEHVSMPKPMRPEMEKGHTEN